MIEIIAYGIPGPQGSKRHVGRGVMVESSKKVKPWREGVHWAAREWIAAWKPTIDLRPFALNYAQWVPLDCPLLVRMVFTMPKPLSAPKTRRTWPMRTPDLSKLLRSTEDALTTAGLWRDDARVVEYARAAKVYPLEDPEALEAPGVRIVIEVVPESAPGRAHPT